MKKTITGWCVVVFMVVIVAGGVRVLKQCVTFNDSS